jgi:opacity protein-like surface antigen
MLKHITLAVFVALAMTSTAYAAAPDRVQHLEIGVLAGGAFNDASEDTGYVQANVAYGITPWIAIGVEGGWQESDTDLAPLGGSSEELGIGLVLADIIVRIPNHPFHEQLVPYFVLGLGAGDAYVTNDSGTSNVRNGDDVDDMGFAWKLGGGLDWFINDNWAIYGEVAYVDVDADLPGTSVGSDSIDFWTVGAGLKFVF